MPAISLASRKALKLLAFLPSRAFGNGNGPVLAFIVVNLPFSLRIAG